GRGHLHGVPRRAAVVGGQYERPQSDGDTMLGVEEMYCEQWSVRRNVAALHAPGFAAVDCMQDHAPVADGPTVAFVGETGARQRRVRRNDSSLAKALAVIVRQEN